MCTRVCENVWVTVGVLRRGREGAWEDVGQCSRVSMRLQGPNTRFQLQVIQGLDSVAGSRYWVGQKVRSVFSAR